MPYQVLARRWRPQTFSELVGQEHVSRTLLNALQSGRIAHAFLFSGPRGSGKTSTARILAKALNCHAGKPGEPCGECPACKEIAAGNCLDVLEIDAASNTGVDNVRELIEQVRYRPARDPYKVYIIDEVHMLSNAAFNALLKTLEEPPPQVVFIMATTEYHKIPATILSRCQQYNFKLLPYKLILERLNQIAQAEKIRMSGAALEQVVFASGGSMRDAMSALDQVLAFSGEVVRDEDVTMLLGLIEPKLLGDTVRAIAENNAAHLLEIVAGLIEIGQDLSNFCRRLLGQFRGLMVLKAGVTDTAVLGVPESLIPDLRRQAELFSREDLLRLFDALLRTENDVKHAAQTRFQLELGLIELAQLTRLRPLEELIADFTSMIDGERTGPGGGFSPASPHTHDKMPPASGSSQPRSDPASGKGNEAPQGGHSQAQADVVPDSRELLLRIAAAVGRQPVESLMQELKEARIEGDSVILEPGKISDFCKRQIKEYLPVIAQAAGKVSGRNLNVRLADGQAREGPQQHHEDAPPEDILERVKREPVVRSFLDVFPGPVKAEKLDK